MSAFFVPREPFYWETAVECERCKTWGETVTKEMCPCPVPCDRCGRLTWPNLGVNLPAGAAVAVASTTAHNIMLARERKLQEIMKEKVIRPMVEKMMDEGVIPKVPFDVKYPND